MLGLPFFCRSGGIEFVSCEKEIENFLLLPSVTLSARRNLEQLTEMPISLSRLGNVLPFSNLFRQLETEMETVVKVLQPGPLGIIEHKFSAEEIKWANATVQRAVENWQRNANIEPGSEILKDFIHK